MIGINVQCPRILRCLGEAIAEKGLRGLLGVVPYIGFVGEICLEAWNKYHEKQQDEDIARAIPEELEQIAQADPAMLEKQARQIAAEILPGQPAKVQEALAGTLMLLPGQIRKTFTCKEDPTGKTRPPAFLVRGPQDLASIIPPRPPRFQEGDPRPNDPKWILVKRLHSGGFGEVWKARHLTLTNRFAAVKFCLDATAQDRLLKHEAPVINQVMQIKNDHIVKLEEIDFNPEAPSLRYEFINGGNLLTSVHMPEDIERRAVWAKNIMLTLAHTVGACHSLNPPVVHRDLKPAKIMIERLDAAHERYKITDFGISEIIAQQALDHVNFRKQISPSMQDLLPETDFRLFAVSVRFPQNLGQQVRLERLQEGVYSVRHFTGTIRLVVVNQLPLQEQNAMLHLFSSRMELVQYGVQHFRQNSSETSTLLFQLFRRYRLEESLMPDVMQEFVRETIDLMLSELPPEKRLEFLGKLPPEERMAGLAAEQRLAGLSPEKRLAGLSAEQLRELQEVLARRLKANGSTAQPE